MSPLKKIRPASEREELIVNFPNRHTGPRESSRSKELLEEVLKAINESPKGIAALDFDGRLRSGEAYETQGSLRTAANKNGLDLQTAIGNYDERTTLYVRRRKESG